MSSDVTHEIRNHLAIAVATIEGIRDEVVAPTPERLDTVLEALFEAELLVTEFNAGRIDVRAGELAHAVLATALRAAGPRTVLALDYGPGGALTIALAPAEARPVPAELETELGVLQRIAEAHGAQVERNTTADGVHVTFRLTPVDL